MNCYYFFYLSWIAKVLNEGSLHNLVLVSMLHIVFVQLAFIARIKNNFVELAAVADRYLIITHVKIKESEKWPFRMSLPVIICCCNNSNKLGKDFDAPNLQYFQFEQDIWKNRSFFMKIIWIWTCSQIFKKKISYGEDLLLFWMMLKLVIFRLWVTIFTQKRAPQQTFTYSKSILETLKRCQICSKLTIKTPGRLSAVFSINLMDDIYA